MSDYVGFFLNSRSDVIQFETLQISHQFFTKRYDVVMNATNGLTVTLETAEVVNFEYYPLRISNMGTRENLDFGIKVDFGDLGEIIPEEIDAIHETDGFGFKPLIVYRTYRSDDLTSPLYGPLVLEATSFSFTREGSTFEAKAPSLNINSTGEIYDLERFPMLRGFL